MLPLLQSHGLNVLRDLAKHGIHYCINHYPANFPLINHALAIGVHSHYIQNIAIDYYGNSLEKKFHYLPFPKELKPSAFKERRHALLQHLGLPIDAFIVSTFGFGSPAKQHELILNAWLNSDLAKIENAFLVFVGEYFNPDYLKNLQFRVPQHLKDRIRFTGFTSKQEYEEYLVITDLAIQLRDQSRGENSAAIMDCLSASVPVVANHHGTINDLPNKIIWKIDHPASPSTLINTIEYLYKHPEVRITIAENARNYLEKKHALAQTGKAYFEMVEDSQALLNSRKNGEGGVFSSESSKAKLLLDITDTAKHDKRTGIQRVVRGLLHGILNADLADSTFAICPIYLDEEGIYRHARQYTLNQFGISCPSFTDDPVNPQRGDVYLDLDFNTITAVEQEHTYSQWRRNNVYVMHIVYDLLPLQNPDWFLPFMEELYGNWLKSVSTHSDALLTISSTVAEQLKTYLAKLQIQGLLSDPPKVHHFNLGSNLSASFPSKGIPPEASALIAKLQETPSILMVSTLEPRKAYAQSLDALEKLWSSGKQVTLLIVGKVGWNAELLANRITSHPQFGEQLFWLSDISDEYLDLIYQNASALLMASYGEGFGLPIAEAARHHLPVIARKIPVFEELGGQNISYFEAQNGDQLGRYLCAWFEQDENQKPNINNFNPVDWDISAKQVLHLIAQYAKAK